jgi:hypothetical protein
MDNHVRPSSAERLSILEYTVGITIMVRKVPTSNPVVATTPIGLIRSKPTAISNTRKNHLV